MSNFEQFLTRFLFEADKQGDFDFEGEDNKRKEEEKKRREEQSQWERDHAANIDDLEDRKMNRKPNTRRNRGSNRKSGRERKRRGQGGWRCTHISNDY